LWSHFRGGADRFGHGGRAGQKPDRACDIQPVWAWRTCRTEPRCAGRDPEARSDRACEAGISPTRLGMEGRERDDAQPEPVLYISDYVSWLSRHHALSPIGAGNAMFRRICRNRSSRGSSGSCSRKFGHSKGFRKAKSGLPVPKVFRRKSGSPQLPTIQSSCPLHRFPPLLRKCTVQVSVRLGWSRVNDV
jgi:hypothetical protein